MAPIAGFALVVISKHVEPLVLRGVERHIARLQPSAGGGNEKLPQRIVPDDAHDRVSVAFFVEPLGKDFRQAIRIDEGFGFVLAVGKFAGRGKRRKILVLAYDTLG